MAMALPLKLRCATTACLLTAKLVAGRRAVESIREAMMFVVFSFGFEF
jgi:hypothetical protein